MIKIDARGFLCPIPVVKVKNEIARLPKEGGVICITVDNKIATENLSKMCVQKGYACNEVKANNNEYLVTITVGEGNTTEEFVPDCRINDGLVVSIGQDKMGGGADELGRILVKGFIFSLASLDVPPKAIVFFNSGVRLTVKGSNTLDDLIALKNKGTTIFVCGTCVDYYGLKDEVAVGEITNMYNIVEILSSGNAINI